MKILNEKGVTMDYASVRCDQNMRAMRRELIFLAFDNLKKWMPRANHKKSKSEIFQVIDFFCGCGGMSLGFATLPQEYSIFRLIGGCDIDNDAVNTYTQNFGVPGVLADIRVFEKNEGALTKFLNSLDNYDEKKPLVLIGCAPCQGFTSHRKKNWEKTDERNSLINIFASIAIKLKPVCIIMENVPEMLSRKYWNHFEMARDVFQRAGYYVQQNIYNAATFGVPQERFRSLIIAMKKEFLMPQPLFESGEFVSVRQAIGHLPQIISGEESSEDRLHRSARHKESTMEVIRAVSKNGGNRPQGIGPKCLDKIKGFSDVYGRLHWDKPAITITRYARNPASGRFVHPEQDRGLTIREAALIQSFPMGFEFAGSFDSIFKQIGEAVPPKFACAVATDILVEILSPTPTENQKKQGVKTITEPVSNSYSSVIAGLKSKRGK